MQSFRTELELENPVVSKDIIDLERKIRLHKEGTLDDDRFRSLRLARGIYGQRQEGVQMIRIKIPFGKLTVEQLRRISDVSDEYSTGRLHITTRQDIQIHYVSLDRTPQLWEELEKSAITIREACGNTVRNITGSPEAGIDPNELFDVSPYAYALFDYLLRYPVSQELGRKFKISFSSSDKDSSYSFMNDLGFIPKTKLGADGKEIKGFKVLVAGGLGAQGILAHVAEEFLAEEEVVSYTEAVIRVFGRYGERNNRNRARLKYLLKDIGLEEFKRLVNEVKGGNQFDLFKINEGVLGETIIPSFTPRFNIEIDEEAFQIWKTTNTFEQKQKGFYGVYGKVQLGDFRTEVARELATLVEEVAADDIRLTIDQNFLLRYVSEDALRYVYSKFVKWGVEKPGYASIADITSCPGTDTCNLGISNSTRVATALEELLYEEYPGLLTDNELKIKISGCMNSCAQHSLAQIGLHGSSIKKDGKVIPALQFMIGGGSLGNGDATIGQRLIKLPSKRVLNGVRSLLDSYLSNKTEDEKFNQYFNRKGKDFFYQLLKPLADLDTIIESDYYDWGHETTYETKIGVGECAGVTLDLVSTLILESEEKVILAKEALDKGLFADSIYQSYNAFVNGAKAYLLREDVQTNTQKKIVSDFNELYVKTGKFEFDGDFESFIFEMDNNTPNKLYATDYFSKAAQFIERLLVVKD